MEAELLKLSLVFRGLSDEDEEEVEQGDVELTDEDDEDEEDKKDDAAAGSDDEEEDAGAME